ncbi:MAG: hypothetical protein NC928_05995 [Candidatus Omnitrophica bacterium]|nr:hypothetical protein [Candidatus Omnitrophota bacterium]
MIFECPGTKRFKRPEPKTIRCSSCGDEVEIWTDEIKLFVQNVRMKFCV